MSIDVEPAQQRSGASAAADEEGRLAEQEALDEAGSTGHSSTKVRHATVRERDGSTAEVTAVAQVGPVGRAHVTEVLTLAATGDPELEQAAPRWTVPVFAIGAALLLPWIVYLSVALPDRMEAANWNLAWTGFDVALALAMLRTAWLAWRRRPQVQLPAVATATLLIIDAWLDVTTSQPGPQLVQALLAAFLIELPMAAFAVYLARHVDDVVHRAERRLQKKAQRLLRAVGECEDGPTS